MKGPCYPIVRVGGELSCNELVQSLGIWLKPARLFPFLPSVEIGGIAHHDYADTMAAADVAGFIEGYLDRFFQVAGDVEDHVGVRGTS